MICLYSIVSLFIDMYVYMSSARIDKLTNELDETKKTLQEKEDNEKQLKGRKEQ
jgi:hypothetical protein